MTTYLISISPNGQWGAEWDKRRFPADGEGPYRLYQGYDQLNAFFRTGAPLNSHEFIDGIKFKIKELINGSVYKSAYAEKLKLLDDADYKFVVIDNVGPHGDTVYTESIVLINCKEFAHIDAITDCDRIDGLQQMNRLYICPKELEKTVFINYNFPDQMRKIDL